MSRPRKCKGKTKAGTRCKAHPLRPGTKIDGIEVSGKWCRQHDQDLPDSARIGGAQPGAGRPAVPRATEVARKLVEENIAAVQRPYWRTLGYDVKIGADGPYLVEIEDGGAKVYGESKEGYINMSNHDDLGAMMNAAEKLQDRAFGRPKQSAEITGAGGGPVELVEVPVRRREVEDLLSDRVRRTPPPVKVGSNGHSNGSG
jgi:hypothetical protein